MIAFKGEEMSSTKKEEGGGMQKFGAQLGKLMTIKDALMVVASKEKGNKNDKTGN